MIGEIEGFPGSQVILARRSERIAGSVCIPGRGVYQIQYSGGGFHKIVELDPSAIPACGALPGGRIRDGPPDDRGTRTGDDEAQPGTVSGRSYRIRALAADGGIAAMTVAPEGSVNVDVMIVYTPKAREGAGGTDGMQALIDAAVAEANVCFENSQVNVRLNLVYSGEVSYTESPSLGSDLDRLSEIGDDDLEEVHPLRDSHHADVVCLIAETEGNPVGIAWIMQSVSMESEDRAFSVVQRRHATGSAILAHELGHNLGCAHDRENATVSGAYDYSYGWRFTVEDEVYRTVMAYDPGIRIFHFSNPNVSYLGVPTGVEQGSVDAANNARSINNTAAVVAAFRGVPPLIAVQPEDRAVLVGAGATFSVTVEGSPPLSYQWLFNGGEIASANNSTLTLTNLQTTQAGRYSVRVSNPAGRVTSAEALLTVELPPSPNLVLYKPAGWSEAFVVSAGTGTHANDSIIYANQQIYIDWAVRNESAHTNITQRIDFKLFVDGHFAKSWFADQLSAGAWLEVEDFGAGPLAPGAHVLRFEIDPENLIGESNETDNIFEKTITILAVPPSIVIQPEDQTVPLAGKVTFVTGASGSAPLHYQWRKDGAPVNGATNSVLILSDVTASDAGKYSVAVSNGGGETASRDAALTVDLSSILVYDNTENATLRYFGAGNGIEFGDQIFLAGTARRIKQIQFDYYLTRAVGGETAELLLRKNDGGPSGTYPQTILYRSGKFSVEPGRNTVIADELDIETPNTFTWSVAFSGVAEGETAGLILAGPPSLGSSFDDFWIDNNGWKLFLLTGTVANFSSRFTASASSANAPELATVGGKARYYSGETHAVSGVEIHMSGGTTNSVVTGLDGTFQIQLEQAQSYLMSPAKANEVPPSQGITSLDITLIRRHILGIAPLDAPFALLAGDVNGSGSVTSLDITLIRRLILGITTNYQGAPLWRFVRSDYSFSNPEQPWTAESERTLTNLSADLANQDFIGIKLGDVNGSWTEPAAALVNGTVSAEELR